MITLVSKLKFSHNYRIADVGAGSGAIGISLALEFPKSQVDMYEISPTAISIVQKNIQLHHVKNCSVYKNNLLSNVTTSYDLVVANLPYVPDSHTINQAAMHEPKLAIFGGTDGLDLYRGLFSQLSQVRPKCVVTESLPFQHEALAKIAVRTGYSLQTTDDFIQVFAR